MGVHTLVVHVLDAIVGLIVLDAGPRLLRSPPVGATAGERRMRAGLAQDARVELGGHAVLVGVGGAPDHLAGGNPVRRQLGQAWPDRGIDVPLQHLGGGVDVRIGVPRAETGLHGLLLTLFRVPPSAAGWPRFRAPPTADRRSRAASAWGSRACRTSRWTT